MSVNILVKRSPTANKRPVGTSMVFGELNLNYDASTGGLYYKNSAGAVVKVGPCQVSATAPNSSPAGSAGNSAGEFWFDSSTDTLKVYNGADWVETGGSVQGISGTAPITVDNTNPLTPVIGVSLGTTSAAGVLQLTDSTSSTSTTTAATPNSVKTAYDLANAALPKAGGTMSGDITLDAALVDGLGSPGASGYILSSTVTGVEWVANTADGVLGVTGNAPITVDNTDPANPVISVNTGSTSQLGALQVGTNVDVAAGVISVADSSTSVKGVVQLNDTTNSTSTTLALTAAQGKNLQDQIDALSISGNLTLAGTLNATTGNLVTVTTEGTAEGFAVGSPLPSPAAGNAEFFVISTVGATSYTPPGGSPVLVHVGDWFLSNGTVWNFLDVGFQAPSASTTVEGVVYLATNAEVQAGTDTSNKAVNPASLQSKISNSVSTTSSSTIASSTAVKSAYDLANSALQRSGGTMTGVITFDAAQTFPITGIQDATTGQKGVVQIGTNINVTSGTISVASASLSTVGVVQLSNAVASSSNTTAATSSAVQQVYDLAVNALPLTGGTLSGPLNLGSSLGDAGGSAGVAGYLLTSTGSATSWQPNSSIPQQVFDAKGDLIVGTGSDTYSRLAVGTNDYVLTADSTQATGVKWAPNTVDGVQGVTGTAPITIDNTDPANPIVEIDAATTSVSGAVQLYDDVDSTSTSLAATANAVKIAYDAALLSGITSATTIYVNNTNGNDSTGERGTTKAFLTITAALAVALNDDTIFLSPGTFTENVTLTKGVTLIGTWQDQSLSDGTTIVGNFVFDMVTPTATSAPSINHIRFNSTNGTTAFKVLNNAQTDGVTVISDCSFTLAGTTAQFCFETAGTWPNSLYMRRPTFDGNIKHAAGTAAGASGYLVLDGILATGSASRHYAISTGTVEFRRPSNVLSPVLQTGGVVLFTDCIAGLTPSNATTSPVFGGTGISYKGAAASLGAGTVYFNGYTPISGVVNIGANMIYGWSGLNVTPANLIISGSAVAYTTAVPAAAAVVTASQQRPRFDLLTTTSSVAAANQLGMALNSTTGEVYTVTYYDAGEF